ncbi:MAG: hypothetical protein ABR949_02995 [Candidatus Aquilonibacter sp.]|jgi:hypothetical protein
MNVEVRIPISPKPHFFRQVEYLQRAFAANGGLAASARFVVSVGEDCEPYDLYEINPWSLGRIEWKWVDREAFRRMSYTATGLDRFLHPTSADVVLLSDADTLLIRNIDDLLAGLVREPAVAGVMAHMPPHYGPMTAPSWRAVFAGMGRRLPRDLYEHSGFGSMFHDQTNRFGPAYYNFGAVFVPGRALAVLGQMFERSLVTAYSAPIHKFFHAQLALTLAIYELDLPRITLRPRYNYPNDELLDRSAPSELADIRIMHYLREGTIGTRVETWGSDERFAAFLARKDLVGSNEVLRQTVAALSGAVVS